MLSHTDEQHRDIGGMNEADQGANHVADSVAFRDDEAVESTDSAEGGIEVTRLGD